MSSVLQVIPLGFPWQTLDPFLFCAYHLDHYPAGNDDLSPSEGLEGRNLGNDFTVKDGYRMYHGHVVPGFPSHPHAGFETVTVGKQGLVDHSDSLGAAGRFGNGDAQWMTAGKGVQHSEMFPLVNKEGENKLEIFQLWLNLPRASKKVDPHFKMLWSEEIPTVEVTDENGKMSKVDLIAGSFNGQSAPSPNPDSWAADPENEVCIWTIRIEAGGKLTIPKASEEVNRALYFYNGTDIAIGDREIPMESSVILKPDVETEIVNGEVEAQILFLQGKPINEPVAQYGPFVANSEPEIYAIMDEFRQTEFGGWPWPSHDHVHPLERGRFAIHADGKEEFK